jgi:LmbE family N-acetylglucosaminyl deacetylase
MSVTTPRALDPRIIRATRIAVVAPHPDDESLGCGGLISILATAGAEFHTVFVTDGGASHRCSLTWPRERLVAQREREAAEALMCLGLGRHERSFLRLPDAGMLTLSPGARRLASARILATLRSFRPELILLPWRRDPHCDHRESWRLVTECVNESGGRPMTLEYAVWLDEIGGSDDFPRREEVERLDFAVTSAIPIKRAAVAAHLSQTSNLIDDDPSAFRLTQATVDRLTGPYETYWRPIQ